MMEKGSKKTAVVAACAAGAFVFAAATAPKSWQKVLFGAVALMELAEAQNEWQTS